jgi:hypothetical protein
MSIVFESSSNIPDDHWIFSVPKEFRVAILTLQSGFQISMFISPKDSRGARLILKIHYSSKESARAAMNRFPHPSEITAVGNAAAIMSQYYMASELVPQIFFLGNNAMSLENDNLVLGKREPFLTHAHILGRHGPNKKFAGGKLDLHATPIGGEFNLIGDSSIFDPKNLPLNSSKVPWKPEEVPIFRNHVLDWLRSTNLSEWDAKFEEWN